MAVDVNKGQQVQKESDKFRREEFTAESFVLEQGPYNPLNLLDCFPWQSIDRMDPAARDKLLDVLQNDLKNISLESKRSKSLSAVRESAGLVTNSILFRWLLFNRGSV